MAPNQRYTLPVMGTLATILVFSSIAQADRVFLTKPTSNIDIFAGCPVDLGFRVQYSGLAMLKTVQLQVLGTDSSVLIDSLGYSPRTEWGDTHTRDISWTVPADWTPGDYVVRAFGNATYPCVQDRHHARCSVVLEDRETIHLKPLAAGGQGCPSITKTLISENTQSNDLTQSSEDQQEIASSDPVSTSSPQDKTDTPSSSANSSSDNVVASNNTDTESSGTEGSSTQLRIILNQATLERIQDQTIRKVLNDTQDYNLLNATMTLLNGTVVPMSDLMDNSTSTRFIQTLETTNATLTSSSNTNNTTGLPKAMGTAELIEALHKNTSLIQTPKSSNSNSTMSFTLEHNNTTANPSGRQFEQHDGDQIQDKSMEGSGNMSAQLSGQLCAVAGLMLMAGSWVL
ncbi:hypothetical protein BG015_004960 [Linnemannia schmuckeri]|uniref:Uncharacterized protein n=1 Tax=Linnemannia schmuckeri TaxID=64567 RepID=A0A9P5S6V6_9FUNG|nr:hypothetical protein BG015_004960 [Linnemannia schmuckeri]